MFIFIIQSGCNALIGSPRTAMHPHSGLLRTHRSRRTCGSVGEADRSWTWALSPKCSMRGPPVWFQAAGPSGSDPVRCVNGPPTPDGAGGLLSRPGGRAWRDCAARSGARSQARSRRHAQAGLSSATPSRLSTRDNPQCPGGTLAIRSRPHRKFATCSLAFMQPSTSMWS